MFKNTLKRLGAIVLALAMAMSVMMVNAFAATASNGSITFTKTLDMSEAPGASVPDVTFTYSIAPATEGVAATANNPKIEVGVQSDSVKVGEAAFAYSDTIGSDKKVSKDVSVTIPASIFNHAGIYRYVITENPTTNADITNDTNTTRILDVYVVNGTNGLEISDYVLLTEATTPTNSNVYESTKKSAGFTNKYTTYSLTLKKEVKGTLADMTKKFNFTIAFEGPANASFTYGNTTVTLDQQGKGSITNILLNNDDTNGAVVTGIPSTVKYTITENIDATEGYTTTNTKGTGTTTGEVTMGKADNEVKFTNEKNNTTPTGVIMNIAPYVLMVALAGGIAFFFLRRRNAE